MTYDKQDKLMHYIFDSRYNDMKETFIKKKKPKQGSSYVYKTKILYTLHLAYYSTNNIFNIQILVKA